MSVPGARPGAASPATGREFPGPLALAAWLALATGLLEAGVVVVRAAIDPAGLSQKNPNFPWMIPVSHLLVFGAAGVPLGLLARVRPGWGPGLWAVPLLGLAWGSLLLAIPGLGFAGVASLAIGLTAWSFPAARSRVRGVRRLVRDGVPALGLAVVVLAALAFGRDRVAERRALAGRPPAASGVPNVLLVVMDTVRADALSLHGYPRDTSPNLSRLAGKGVRFDRAIAPSSWTLPSHASLFTGRWPTELSEGIRSPLDGTHPTLAEFLAGQGYTTAGFAANDYFCNRWYGLDRGFDHYEDYAVSPLEVFRTSALGWLICRKADALASALKLRVRREFAEDFHRKDAARINRDALAWLSGLGDRPFFAFLNYFDAHTPYVVPEGSGRHFGLRPQTAADDRLLRKGVPDGDRNASAREVALTRDNYDDCLASMDEQFGKLLGELDRRGVLANTLVIVTSDHGEHFGEHGHFGHTTSVYQPVIRVPLVLAGPVGLPEGRVIAEPVSLRDLPATVADLLAPAVASPFPGASLANAWRAGQVSSISPAISVFDYRTGLAPAEVAKKSAPGVLAAIVDGGMSFILNDDGREELYDLANDPEEARNLADSPEHREALERLREELRRRLRGTPPGSGG